MGTTPNFAFRYPALTAAPNVPLDLQNLATDVDTSLLAEQVARAASDTVTAAHSSGIIARHRRTTNGTGTTASTAATAQKYMEVTASLKTGRLYRVQVQDMGVFCSVASGAETNVQITFTTDGSVPAPSSSVLTTAQVQTLAGSLVASVTIGGTFVPSGNVTFRALVSYFSSPAGPTVNAFASGTWPAEICVEDLGVDPGSSGTDF